MSEALRCDGPIPLPSPGLPRPSAREAEAELWARVVRQESGADAELVRHFQGCVRRFLARMLGEQDPAVDDALQLTFITALARPDRFEGRASLRSWLLGIAHNKARMTLRSRARRQRALSLWGHLRSRAAAPPCAETQQAGTRIQAALATLDPNRRAVFLLTEVEGFTAAEAAAAVGAPAGTVRRWRVEARQRLQPLLADLRPPRETP